jgi:biopolymer transport protein ExbB/TolQ
MTDLVCPHCQAANPRPAGEIADILDCVGCDRSFAVGPSETPSPVRAAEEVAELGESPGNALLPSPLSRQRWAVSSSAPTDVSMPLTGLAAVGLTLLFYIVLVSPLERTYFGELFSARGWVPYVITWLSAWAGLLLAIKAWLLAGQRRSLGLDLLPESISPRITPANAHVFASYLRHLSTGGSRNFLFDRVLRAVELFRARRRVREVVDQLANQAVADASAVDSSYTMVRVFIWAIPILGFIGTVLGIGAAVRSFSDSVAAAVDLEVMKHSIGAVTSGLGVAFDTTLLALVMSILIMFPASSLQKAEEDFLARVDAFCEKHLVRRLEDGRDRGGGETGSSQSMTALEGAAAGAARTLGRLEADLARLASSVVALDERLSRSGEE